MAAETTSKRFVALIDSVSGWAAKLATFFLLGSFVGALGAVFLRSVPVGSIGASGATTLIDIQWYFFGLSALLMTPLLLRERRHVAIDLWTSKQNEEVRLRNERGLVLPSIAVCALVLMAVTFGMALNAVSIAEGAPSAGGLPRYPIKAAIPLSMLLLFLQALAELLRRP